ncbi:DnaJ-domain-containing protein [Polyplosphaeria fusca]|uniref:DnaJ-domain-containing protein n=1 Tax=Polyplosphaeria fusca TaxID=682080 RepID=A0A9P4V3C0_9PLEO|nr:DnaJ-domain-containing protein [Polyplosphaeria fusca]
MGAAQSTGEEPVLGAVEVKTSYYELLGVERTATEDELKKAYRKKALELHPDRNFGDVERTTALFSDIQSAYEVLSDPQERAWYDAHEGDILRGGEGGAEAHYEHNMRSTTADDIARMMGKFRGSTKYTDAPDGFFGFLRDFFEQLVKEEEHAANYEGVDVPVYPFFGHKDDTYDDVVRSFYAVWSGFSTRKSFAWKDIYRMSEAPDRRIRRLMEKENQRLRDAGIREYNDAVRTLILFVRRRDPRYTPNTQTEEQRAKAQRDAAKAQAARSRAAQAAKLQEAAIPSWATAREPEELVEDEEEEEVHHYECEVCKKTFKSDAQFEAHEKSKKHQKAVSAVKRKMHKENAMFNLDREAQASGVVKPMSGDEASGDAEAGSYDDDIENLADSVDGLGLEDGDGHERSSLDGESETEEAHAPAASTAQTSSAPETDDDDDDDEYASRSDIEARLAGFRNTDELSTAATSLPETSPETEAAASVDGPKLGKAAQKRAKKAAKQAEQTEESAQHKCNSCNKDFSTKNQLFQHLKDFPKHAALKPATGGGGGKRGKKK